MLYYNAIETLNSTKEEGQNTKFSLHTIYKKTNKQTKSPRILTENKYVNTLSIRFIYSSLLNWFLERWCFVLWQLLDGAPYSGKTIEISNGRFHQSSVVSTTTSTTTTTITTSLLPPLPSHHHPHAYFSGQSAPQFAFGMNNSNLLSYHSHHCYCFNIIHIIIISVVIVVIIVIIVVIILIIASAPLLSSSPVLIPRGYLSLV